MYSFCIIYPSFHLNSSIFSPLFNVLPGVILSWGEEHSTVISYGYTLGLVIINTCVSSIRNSRGDWGQEMTQEWAVFVFFSHVPIILIPLSSCTRCGKFYWKCAKNEVESAAIHRLVLSAGVTQKVEDFSLCLLCHQVLWFTAIYVGINEDYFQI